MVFNGGQGNIQIGKESAYGTPVTANKDIGLVKSISDNSTANIYEGFHLGGLEMNTSRPTFFEFGKTIEIDIQHFRFLEYVLGGTVAHSATDTPDIKHTFSLANTVPSFTMDINEDATSDKVFEYSGCAINSATINFPIDSAMNASLDIVGKDVDTSGTSATAAVVDSLDVFTPSEISISVGGASITLAKEASLTIENAFADANYLGSVTRAHAVPTQKRYAFTFTADFADMTEYNRFLGGTSATAKPTEFSTIINASNGVSAGSGRREFNIEFDNCIYAEAPLNVPSDGLTNIAFTVICKNLDESETYSYDNIASGDW